MDGGIRKVVIVGRDAAGWLSALTLQLAFGRSADPVEVEFVELPSALQPQDVYVTLPTQRGFHKLLGIDETHLLRAAAGVYVLGQRFSNWSGSAEPFLHAYDTIGVSLNDVDFFQHWVKARTSGLKVPLEEFSLGAAAAKQGRFVIFNESTQSFSNASYGYHLDAIPYLRAVGKRALGAGLKHTVGELASVSHEDRRIASITLADGTTISADLFVDASGPQRALMRELDAGDFESWSNWLPCDRLMVASAPVLSPMPAFSQVSAFHAGWLGIFPLMNRTALVTAYSSQHVDDEYVLQSLSALSGLRIEGDTIKSAITPGALRSPWINNCVAVGDSAITLDPLDAVQMHVLHSTLAYLVSLFPVDRDSMPEATVYNAKLASHAAGLRDFQIAHFKLSRRFNDRLWSAASDMDVPETLARKLGLFESRGIVSLDENETFQEENWTSIFVGHGLLPKSWDPLVDKVPEQEQIANFQRILKFIATEVESMPSLEAQVELNAPRESEYIF